jgi:hypothetical protein
MRILALCVCALFLAGCPGPAQLANPPAATGGAPAPASAPSSVAEAEKALADAQRDLEAAKLRVKQAETDLRNVQISSARHKLWAVVFGAILGALGCVAGFIWLPGVRKFFAYGFFACVAVAALALTLAAILPYLIWIGIGLALVLAGFGFYCWRNDHKAFRQVVGAVETYKDRMAGYREHFSRAIDTDADKWINRTRSKLGLLKAKV